ncbi:MAG: DUF1491 family protein [Maricaulaceae bacterium]|nr:DUF1491 family protein [Maricaulaceae bacterium]
MGELKARFWVQALIRRAEAGGASAYVARRGDDDAGAALVVVVLPERTALLYAPARDFEGRRVWTQPLGAAPVPEAEIAAYAAKRADSDPDIWVVEIEDRAGRHFLTEPVEAG